MLEGIEHCFVCWLSTIVRIKQSSGSLSGKDSRNPGSCICESPDLDYCASSDRQTGSHYISVEVSLTVSIMLRSMPSSIHWKSNVELGDVDLQTKVGESTHCSFEGCRRDRIECEMTLKADAIERHTPLLEIPSHRKDRLKLSTASFECVVVVEELGLRIGGMRQDKRAFDVSVWPFSSNSRRVIPDRRAQAAIGMKGLVDHVPCINRAREVFHNGLDVLGHEL